MKSRGLRLPSAARLGLSLRSALFSLLAPSALAGLISAGPNPVKTFRVFEIAASANAPAAMPYKDGPNVSVTFAHTSSATFVAKDV